MPQVELTNLIRCLEHQKLDVRVSFEDRIKEKPFAVNCYTTAQGTHYHHFPTADENAPVIILLHALGGNSFNWLPIAAELDDYNLYALDLPSHGQTKDLAVTEEYTEAYTAWLSDFVAELHIKNPHLVGLSTGGKIAADYALDGQDVGSLTMFAPALNPEKGFLFHSIYGLIRSRERKLLKNVGYGVLLRLTARRDPLSKYAIKMAHNELIRDQARRDYLGLRQTMTWLLEETDYTSERWRTITEHIPCKALFANKDICCPSKNHLYLINGGVVCASAINSGHLIPFDNTPACVVAIKDTVLRSNKNTG